MRHIRRISAAAALVAAFGSRLPAQVVDEHLLSAFTYRNLGPFRMGARVSDLAVPAKPAKDHLYTWYVSFWTGGLWKTTNNGTTFDPVFDNQGTFAIGDVTVAPSNPDIVWVGTGDAFTSRSSYAGDGVYKSTDGAKTWTNMGLHDSHHIARIVIEPTNPDIVYVAAMGHLYSDNAERGVFKTTDGGKTWSKSLFISDRVGVIDLVMDPRNPQILYAAAYDKQRLPWQMVNGGPGSGIYKTTDGGQNWAKLAGGLPEGRIGRIGLDIYLANADILYAVIENENARTTPLAATGRGGGGGGGRTTIGGEVYRTDNGGQTWKKTSADDYDVSPKGAYYFSQIRVNPADDKEIYVTQDGLRHSTDGGKTWDGFRMFPRMFGDVRTLWIDPENPLRMIQGSDGGIAMSYDGGRTGDAYSNIPVGEIYTISADNEDPYNIYAGLQDHEHWRGPTNTGLGRVAIFDWFATGNGDGIAAQVDPKDSRWLYTTREYGNHTRVDQKFGYTTTIEPRRPAGQEPYRFLWEAPLVLSPFDSKTLYAGAQVLLKSVDRGDHWTEISPDLSTHPTDKIMRESEGLTPGGIPWFAISSISESPMTRGVIWVGTADGKVQITRDAGKTWTDRTSAITSAGGREDAFARVVASSHVPGRAYVVKSGYKFDDFHPYVYRTDDYGATWTSLAAGLPNEPVNVIVEDSKNTNLLFLGDDAGLFVSLDRGAHWTKMNNNMPSIPVHDILVHPRERDLILGTYARDLWITNVDALEQLTDSVLAKDAHLFAIRPTVQRVTWQFAANDYLFGQRHIQTPNDPPGMMIRYYLKSASASPVAVVVTDSAGKEVARLQGTGTPGINTVMWSTRKQQTGGRGGNPGARGTPGTVLDQLMPLGRYTVTLQVGDKKLTQPARIVKTQGWPLGTSSETIRKVP